MPIIGPHIDPANYGGLKGSSTTHYLINLLHFIHSHVDQPKQHAVLLAQADIQKAFNNVFHQLVIQDMFDMHVPGWLLRIFVSYLTGRNMTLRYAGATSSSHMLPGSSPQGVYLGVLLFIIKFNGAFLCPTIPRQTLTDKCHKDKFTAKYIDDTSRAQVVDLKECLTEDRRDVPRPVTYHQRTGHTLKPEHNQIQHDHDNFEEFTNTNLFTVSAKKSPVMLFNFSHTYDFLPELHLGGEQLSVVSESKILGLIISDNLRFDSHVEYICKRARKRIWLLRRLMQLGVDFQNILDFYYKEIRSVLEYGSVVFNGSLTKLSNEIESVQRLVLKLLSNHLNLQFSYEEACTFYCTEPLSLRRIEQSENFIRRNLHSGLFSKSQNAYNTRAASQIHFKEFKCNTNRFYNSPLVYLTRLANKLNLN